MKLLVTGAAGFIGSTYVRLRRRGARREGARQAHLCGPAREPSRGRRAPRRRDRGPGHRARGDGGMDAVVNFAAESHVDRSIDDQDAFARTHVFGTSVLLDAARELGVRRYLQVSTDEVYGSIESGSFTESSPLDPSSPYSATKAAGDLLVSAHVAHLRGRGGDLPRVQQLRPSPVPGEADPADGAERAARGLAAGLRGRPPGPQLALRRGLLPRHPHRAARRSAGPRLQRRRPGRVREHRGGQARDRADRRRRVPDRARQDRPGHDRRYSLGSERISTELGWEARVHFAEGLERTVEWYRENEEWWGPIRSGEYREYYEKQYGKTLG